MSKLRTWWKQLCCEHHWHRLSMDAQLGIVAWECCWCLKSLNENRWSPGPCSQQKDCFMGKGNHE